MKRPATLLMVLAACGALRVWLIGHTDVISRDGTIYVRMAREFPSAPLRVIQEYDYHVGYPAAMTGVHWFLGAMGLPDGVSAWELSGQIVSLEASLAGMVAVWLLAGMIFNWRIAWISALLFGISRKWSALGADVLSDALAVCFQMWAVVFAVVVLGQLKRKNKRSIALAACVGLCCGLGYLVRPEALLVAALAGALWLAYQFRQRESLRLTVAAVGVAWAVALVCALPYMTAIGGLTKKKSFSDLVAMPLMQDAARATASFISVGKSVGAYQFVRQIFEAMHPLVAALACVWLVGYAIDRFWRSKKTQLVLPSPRPAGTFMMLGMLVVICPLLIGLYANVHYLSHRHVIFLAALLSPLAGAGVIVLADFVAVLLKRIGVRRISPTTVLAIMVGVMAASLSLHTLRPLHGGKGYLRQAGQLVAESTLPGDYVLADSSWILHYSQVQGERVPPELIKTDSFGLWVRRSKATHLVLSDGTIRRVNSALWEDLVVPRFAEIGKFVKPGSKQPDTIRIYRINRGTPSQTSDKTLGGPR